MTRDTNPNLEMTFRAENSLPSCNLEVTQEALIETKIKAMKEMKSVCILTAQVSTFQRETKE